MSYINNALKKAQQEKDSLYSRYSGVISGLPGPRSHRRRTWLVVAVSMMLMLVVLFVWVAATGRLELPAVAWQQTPEKAITAGHTQASATVAPAVPVARTIESESSVAAVKVDSATPAAMTAIEPASTVARTEPVGSAVPAKRTPLPEVGTIYRKALAAQQNKRAAVAERLYRRILTLDARHVEAMNNLGVLYMGQGRQKQAVVLFSKAIAMKKDYVDPYYNLACLYAQRKNTAKSIAYLKLANAIDEDIINWAKTDMDLKNISESKEFKKLMEKKGK
jgi:tetratricopeptide (TPR) repeat protein